MSQRVVFLLVCLAPGTALAQQLVTFDQVVTITERGNGAGAFHYLIKPAATEPASWTTPVDYSKGTAYVHMEVMAKPSKRVTTITICFDGNLAGYGCITTSSYTDVGIVDTTRNLPRDTWQYNQIAWSRRRQEYHLVVKDPALGGTPGGRPATDYAPTTMRIVMTVVPPGGTYTPPPGVAAPATDAGADTARGDAAPPAVADASPAPKPADAAAAAPDAAPASDAVVSQDAPSPPPVGTPLPPTNPPTTTDPPTPPAKKSAATGGCAVADARGGGGLFLAVALLTAARQLSRSRSRRIRRP